ncbi:MAG: hypothetical protein MHMPM18_001930 [Marteilia pararefringens]
MLDFNYRSVSRYAPLYTSKLPHNLLFLLPHSSQSLAERVRKLLPKTSIRQVLLCCALLNCLKHYNLESK